MPIGPPKPVFFPTPADLRRWFSAHHASAAELWVGYHKRATGTPSVTWPESVDQALCFGWIDGIRKRIDDDTYTIRFTPRRPGSVWSAVNLGRVKALTAAKQMKPAGLAAFEARKPGRSYSYEQRRTATLTPAFKKRLRENPTAQAFFAAQPPGYQRLMAFWVMDAKREETREKRFATLLAECAAGRRIGVMTPASARPKS